MSCGSTIVVNTFEFDRDRDYLPLIVVEVLTEAGRLLDLRAIDPRDCEEE